MAYTDKTLTCVDCGASFTFTARDQEFHAQKGFANEPKRCFNCRQARRVARGEAPAAGAGPRQVRQPVYSGPRAAGAPAAPAGRPTGGRRDNGRPGGRRRDFDRERGGDGGNEMAGQRSFDGGASAPTAYTAPCTACGKDTPVSGSGGGMVFCPECYNKMAAIARS